MTRILLILLFFIAYGATLGQTERHFYYNRNWQLTQKDSAIYHRVAAYDTLHYHFEGDVLDMDMSSVLVMTGKYEAGRKNGLFTFFYPDGGVEYQGTYVDNFRKGLWKYSYPNSKPKCEVLIDGLPSKVIFFNDSTGKRVCRDGNGYFKEEYEVFGVPHRIVSEGRLKDNLRVGTWRIGTKDGEEIVTQDFKFGVFHKGKIKIDGRWQEMESGIDNFIVPHYKFEMTERLSKESDVSAQDYPFLARIFPGFKGDEIFTVVEKAATPQAGIQAFYKAMSELLNYPADAKRRGIEGKVFVEFVINKDGSITGAKVIKGLGYGCDEEALRVLMEAQKKVPWNPGEQRGKPVMQQYTLPIFFRLP